MSDNIVPFPGKKTETKNSDNVLDFVSFTQDDFNINISWDDVDWFGVEDTFLGSEIIQDVQLENFKDKLEDLYYIVKTRPELCQFADKYITAYLENMKKKT